MPKDRLTLEQFRAEQCYLELTPKQKKLVETFISSNGDRVLSVMAAYATKSEANARILAYEFFASPRVVAALAAYFQDDPLESFKADLRKAYRNSKLSVAQVSAMELIAKVSGWGAASLPSGLLHGHDKAENADPEPAAPVKKFHVGQCVRHRRPDGSFHDVIIRAMNADGVPTKFEDVVPPVQSPPQATAVPATSKPAPSAVPANPPAAATIPVAPVLPEVGTIRVGGPGMGEAQSRVREAGRCFSN
jgi:hypothetical protein